MTSLSLELASAWHVVHRSWKLDNLHSALVDSPKQVGVEQLKKLLQSAMALSDEQATKLCLHVAKEFPVANSGSGGEGSQLTLIDVEAFLRSERSALRQSSNLCIAKLIPGTSGPLVFPAAANLITQSFHAVGLPHSVHQMKASDGRSDELYTDAYSFMLLQEALFGQILSVEERRGFYYAVVAATKEESREDGKLIPLKGFVAAAYNNAINEILAPANNSTTLNEEVTKSVDSIITPPHLVSTASPSETGLPQPVEDATHQIYEDQSGVGASGANGFDVLRGTQLVPMKSTPALGEGDYSSFAMDRRDRCLPHSPSMKRPLALDESISEGHRRFVMAENAIKTSQLGSSWDDAVSIFDRAATQLLFDGYYVDAGHAYVRCADCRSHLHDEDSMCSYYISAAQAYAKANFSEAVAALACAIENYASRNKWNKVAKLTKQKAGYESQANRFQEAYDSYREAGRIFSEKLAMKTDGKTCLHRAAEIAVTELGDLGGAIETLEVLHTIAQPSEQPLVLCKATACRLVCVPPEYTVNFIEALSDTAKTFSKYQELCPQMLTTSEYTLMNKLLKTLETGDCDEMEDAIGRYLMGHPNGDPWLETVLRQIHTNCESKKNGVEKLFKL